MEILDLYNENGERLGSTMDRSNWKKGRDEYVKVVHVFLMNAKGEILIQQRAFSKEVWPGRWSILGGFVQSREEPEKAVLRETSEEYGVDISDYPRRMIHRILQRPRGVIMDYWIVLADIPIKNITCQPEEVESAVYVTPEELYGIYSDAFRWVGDDALYRDDVLLLIARIPQIFSEFAISSQAYI
ncbi:MAG: NUDIX domain-containing protein [Clostridia bacterium]|nr:NUDIX domain-containing protein [Clostridia bacterium]